MMSRIVDLRPRPHLRIEVINLSAAGNCSNVSAFADSTSHRRIADSVKCVTARSRTVIENFWIPRGVR